MNGRITRRNPNFIAIAFNLFFDDVHLLLLRHHDKADDSVDVLGGDDGFVATVLSGYSDLSADSRQDFFNDGFVVIVVAVLFRNLRGFLGVNHFFVLPSFFVPLLQHTFWILSSIFLFIIVCHVLVNPSNVKQSKGDNFISFIKASNLTGSGNQFGNQFAGILIVDRNNSGITQLMNLRTVAVSFIDNNSFDVLTFANFLNQSVAHCAFIFPVVRVHWNSSFPYLWVQYSTDCGICQAFFKKNFYEFLFTKLYIYANFARLGRGRATQ